jgi:hypothetical protein
MRDYLEMQMFQQMFGGGGLGSGGGQVWLMIAFLAGLFGVLFWRPATLKHLALFRWSCTLFALAIMAPPLMTMGITLYMGDNMRSGPASGAMMLLQISSASGPALFGLSVVFGFASLMPSPVRPATAAEEKGPFD